MDWSQPTLPDYWMPQPAMALSAQDRLACDALLASAIEQGAIERETSANGELSPIAYSLSIPKWQFLCYVAEQHQLALHGSNLLEIVNFEPRQPSDLTEFGAQNAVYAAADGIWPMYFAIVDRDKSPSIINACVYLEDVTGTLGQPFYFFSISQKAIARQPYRAGMVYLLPRQSFVREAPFQAGTMRVHTAQLASFEAVVPLAKLAIAPEDFPFLAQMRTHDDERLALYAEAMIKGLPWPD